MRSTPLLVATHEPDRAVLRDGSGADGGANLHTRLQALAEAAAASAGMEGAVVVVLVTPGAYRAVAVAGNAPVALHEAVRLNGELLVGGDGTPRARFVSEQTAAGATTSARRAIGVPLDLFGHEVGMLVAVPKKSTRQKVTALRTMLGHLASEAAPLVAAGRLEVLEMHATEVNSIVDVGQVLTGLLEMDDVLSYVVYLAESLVSGHSASIALLSEDASELVLHTSTGSLRDSEGLRVPVQGSLLGWVVKRGESVITQSLAEDPRAHPLEGGQGPGVVVPIMSSGKVIGAFLVGRVAGAHGFGSESATILQTMSAYAAIAITNAEIHRQQQRTAETLRSQAAELEQAYEGLRRSQDQLLISEKMAALGKVTASIAHEINSPLGGVLNALRAARGYVEEYRTSAGDPDVTAEDHRAIATDIASAVDLAESAVGKVAQFVKSIKGQTRAGEGGSTTFDPASEIDATIALIQHDVKRRRAAVFTELERGHSLTGDQGKFGVVIQNLVSNAVDAYEGKPGEVWVRMNAHEGKLCVSVEDRGSGIPEEIRGRIFDYLFTTKGVGKGTGLGLAMVHSVVTSNFGGEIALETEPGVGSTFTLTFPLSVQGDHGA